MYNPSFIFPAGVLQRKNKQERTSIDGSCPNFQEKVRISVEAHLQQ